jgi:hypothetical protein
MIRVWGKKGGVKTKSVMLLQKTQLSFDPNIIPPVHRISTTIEEETV